MVDEDGFVALAKRAPDLPRSVVDLLELGEEGLARVRAATEGADPDGRLDEVTLLPVIPEPPAIWCVGINYDAHRRKRAGSQPNIRRSSCASRRVRWRIARPWVRPKASTKLDYEGELAVIIGKPGRHIAEGEAMRHVAGYSCYNDGSVRDWQRHTSQFGPGKNFYRTGAFGPWLVTADELENPYAQILSTGSMATSSSVRQSRT